METPENTLDFVFWLTAGGIICLLLMSAFFSASETALTAASRPKLRSRADRGDRGAEAALKAVENSEKLIGAILLGNNVANILAASLATALFTRAFGSGGVALATLVMTVLVLIFSEVLPKTYAITLPESVASRVAKPILWLIVVLTPIVAAVRLIVRGLLRLFGVRMGANQSVFSFKEEIAGAIALGSSDGTLDKEERDRLLGALDLDNRTVEEIMLHRSQIEMLDVDLPPHDMRTAVLNSPHTRLPLYKGERENVVGVIHAKDLLRAIDRSLRTGDGNPDDMSDLDVTRVAMKPYFIPETTPLNEQMREFLKRRMHFALVVDEYGDLRGLVTLEDIIEEIVGEITDEMDPKAERLAKAMDNGEYLVEGTATIRDLNREMDWTLPDADANTIAGLVIQEAQTIPDEGQVFAFHGFRFEVASRKGNRIAMLKIKPLLPTAPGEG
ncbi:MAG TPA: HlyC/CorC family transporter [Paenirhodobacter sp.]